ncbi:TPA: hypothetical protein N0F65_002909 [Lagenidium giganteum]|uniref:RBR-type E3 ubiquitin transferase n=1 Tax=Lagenidium giganteum TaxID=4803 RepID=A0AAV2Z4C0_9STRA|nr:TPA: hypothetical protein N0F65_002909 [Lagenidium giganteum]
MATRRPSPPPESTDAAASRDTTAAAAHETERIQAFLRALATGALSSEDECAQALDRFAIATAPQPFLLIVQQRIEKRSTFENRAERDRWRWLVERLRHVQSAAGAHWRDVDGQLLDEIDELVQSRAVRKTTDALPPLQVHRGSSLERRDSQPMAPERPSWHSLSRMVRAASGRTVRALMPTRDRGSEIALSRLKSPHSASMREQRASSLDETVLRRSNSTFTGSAVPSLLWAVASFLGMSMEHTFLCQICYENVAVSKAFQLTRCDHLFCEDCLKGYLEFKISEGQVYPTCFHECPEDSENPVCSADIAPEDIQDVVSAAAWEKYTTFKFNKENKNARQCPYCDHSQLCKGEDQPEEVCASCGGEFCFVHSNAHKGRSCAEYEQKMVAIDKLNHAMINEISKPCPGCDNYVEKIVIDDKVFPEHFQWWNVSGCPGNQMSDVDEQTTADRICLGIFRALFFVIFGPPALVLAIMFSFVCCCCFPCVKVFDTSFREAFTTCFCISGYVLLAPFALILVILLPCFGLCCDVDRASLMGNTEEIVGAVPGSQADMYVASQGPEAIV